MALSGGYDEDTSGDLQAGGATLPFGRAGQYTNLQTTLRYTRGRRERRLTFTAADAVRYYPTVSHLLTANYAGGVALTSPLWRGGRFDVSQNVAYTPYYQFEIFPALPVDPGTAPAAPSSDYAIGKQSAYTYTSSVQFAHSFSPRSALTLGYDRRSVVFANTDGGDLLTQGGAIRFSHRVTRYAGFHAGIASRVGQYGSAKDSTRIQTHDLDIGLDYNRPIAFSRRTTFNFSTGSSLTPENGRMRYRVTGHAALNHEIARTWTASLLYNRALQFVEAFPQPYFSDSISARVGGSASRRVDLMFSGAYATGEMSGAAVNGTLGTYTATAGSSIAVNRHVALSADYLYYHYRLGQQTVSAVIPDRLDRQTVRIGLKLWLPVD